LLETNKGTLTIECEADDVPIRIMQGERVVENLTVSREGKSTRIAAGKYTVEIDHAFDKAIVKDGVVRISRGKDEIVKVTSKPNHDSGKIEITSPPIDEANVSVNVDSEAGIMQIRGKSRDAVKRVADVIGQIEKHSGCKEETAKVTSRQNDDSKRIDAPSPQIDEANVSVNVDSETGIMQIRAKSRDAVKRAADVIEHIKKHSGDKE
jgi:hypothetical protein